ncbi:MAG: prolipoprotein diacylglyceryl transferase [Chlorobium sp.]|nr:prolipoprotein diacylglyceryl transferase [Chlorobium sp.]
MTEQLFLGITGVLFAALFAWGFRALPGERWQMLAAIPLQKQEQGQWRGLNLTYYGFLLAGATNLVLHLAGAPELNLLVVLAALAISYVLGEGLGRLSCLSYGCCYGKPLKDCHWLTRKIFSHCFFVFTGATKKVAYDGGLEGEKLFPIQALTCVLYTATALISSHYFLQGRYAAAFLLSLIVSQLWRFLSETMRADFRGFGRISVYQPGPEYPGPAPPHDRLATPLAEHLFVLWPEHCHRFHRLLSCGENRYTLNPGR